MGIDRIFINKATLKLMRRLQVITQNGLDRRTMDKKAYEMNVIRLTILMINKQPLKYLERPYTNLLDQIFIEEVTYQQPMYDQY